MSSGVFSKDSSRFVRINEFVGDRGIFDYESTGRYGSVSVRDWIMLIMGPRTQQEAVPVIKKKDDKRSFFFL